MNRRRHKGPHLYLSVTLVMSRRQLCRAQSARYTRPELRLLASEIMLQKDKIRPAAVTDLQLRCHAAYRPGNTRLSAGTKTDDGPLWHCALASVRFGHLRPRSKASPFHAFDPLRRQCLCGIHFSDRVKTRCCQQRLMT